MNQPAAPTNPNHSTGPLTDAGKDRSSRNATKTGLYSTRDLVLDETEAEIYTTLRDGIWKQLSPDGVLEETFASEIVTANWRLRRCGLLEAALARPWVSG